VAFWLDVVAGAGPRAGGHEQGERRSQVLELACGTGRVTIPLAAAGFEVTGLDVDAAALALAGQRRGALRWPLLIAADMRRFSLHCRFDAVIVPYNSFQLLIDLESVAECLGAVAEHLAPGGTFGLEVTDFQAGARHRQVPDEVIASASFDGERLTLSGSLSHDLDRRVSRYRRRFSAERWEVTDEVVLRSYRLGELRAALAAAGFTARRWWSERAVTRVTAQAG
jgi:SAM-dependent methyltransferase